jgi:hypothetical protein
MIRPGTGVLGGGVSEPLGVDTHGDSWRHIAGTELLLLYARARGARGRLGF